MDDNGGLFYVLNEIKDIKKVKLKSAYYHERCNIYIYFF